MYYRNSIPISGVDPHALWILQEDSFVLVDDDEFVSVDESQAKHFYPVETPFMCAPDVL